MRESEMDVFGELITNVHAFYRLTCSPFAIGIWWQALHHYDFETVGDALNRHCSNPDSGQFMPRPADVTRMLGGSTKDAAMLAWSRVDRAVRSVGPYQSVAFDDATVHRVIADMGGWTRLCTSCTSEDEWVFVGKDFETRYRAYLIRNDVGQAPGVLVGLAGSHNPMIGAEAPPPVLIGDTAKALAVIAAGDDAGPSKMTRLTGEEFKALTAPSVQKTTPKRLR